MQKAFSGKGLKRTVKQVTLACDLCACNNPQTHPIPPSLLRPIQCRGTYPGEDWQLNFTQCPHDEDINIFWCLLILSQDGLKPYPTRSEKTMEVCMSLLKEIIPWFGLPKSLQSDNRPFITIITQGFTMALGIDYKLHTSWHPQSSGKVEKMNHTLEKTLAKLCQKTHEPWTNLHSSGSV